MSIKTGVEKYENHVAFALELIKQPELKQMAQEFLEAMKQWSPSNSSTNWAPTTRTQYKTNGQCLGNSRIGCDVRRERDVGRSDGSV